MQTMSMDTYINLNHEMKCDIVQLKSRDNGLAAISPWIGD